MIIWHCCEEQFEPYFVDVLIGIPDQPGATLTKAMAYIETSPADLLLVSQVAGYLLFYGGPQKLDAVLNVFESVEDALGIGWAFLARLGFAASEAGQRTAHYLLYCHYGNLLRGSYDKPPGITRTIN